MRLLQITDLHLRAEPEACMQGRVIRRSLDTVLNAALESVTETPELIVISGDIADEEQEQSCAEAYRYLKKRLKRLDSKIRYLPGNHDQPRLLNRSFGAQARANLVVDNWQLIFLDSSLNGSLGGRLDAMQLKVLRGLLDSQPAEHALIFLHHPPIAIGSRWLDRIGLQNGAEFINLIAEYSSVKAVVFGHIHQQFESEVAGIRMMGAPATCPRQFLPGSDEFRVDTGASSGFRWLTLLPDGTLDSQVVRV